jgi:CRISPR-associated protein Cas6
MLRAGEAIEGGKMTASATLKGFEHTVVELSFRLVGHCIPVDHGYALYAAISRHVPEIHDAREIGVQPIRGTYGGDGLLYIAPFSRLTLRLPDDRIRHYLKLAGQTLDVKGHPLRISMPEARKLLPIVSLRSRLVTIKGFLDKGPFLEAAARQLQSIGVRGEVLLGERRTFRVKDKHVVGFEVAITGLTAEESLTLQEEGLGGRRRMGCGVFVPWRG